MLRFRREELRPHGDDDGGSGVALVEEDEVDVIRRVRLSMSLIRFQPTKFISLIGYYWDLLPWCVDWGLPENGFPHLFVPCSRSK